MLVEVKVNATGGRTNLQILLILHIFDTTHKKKKCVCKSMLDALKKLCVIVHNLQWEPVFEKIKSTLRKQSTSLHLADSVNAPNLCKRRLEPQKYWLFTGSYICVNDPLLAVVCYCVGSASMSP